LELDSNEWFSFIIRVRLYEFNTWDVTIANKTRDAQVIGLDEELVVFKPASEELRLF
jgi:hypothetical protein